jgi:putative polyhydroxyalkanoate system protein
MADILIEREHTLGLEQAVGQIEALADLLGSELDARCVWSGTRLELRRSGATGSIEVTETHLTLEVHLGFLLKPLKGSIEQTITERLDRLIPSPCSG